MKNEHAVKITAPFEAWARDVVDRTPGFVAEWGPDLILQVNGRTRPLIIEFKRVVDAATARILADRARPGGEVDFLVVTETTTVGARRTLESNGVGYVDGHGNAHVRLPGVFIHTADGSVRSRAKVPRPTTRLSGKAGLVVQALLLAPGREWQIAELGTNCEVSTGLVHRVLARLEAAGVVVVRGAGPAKRRQLAKAAALLELWVEEDEEAGMRRYAAFVLPATALPLSEYCSTGLDRAGILHAITGTAAAADLASALTSVPVSEIRIGSTVRIDEALTALGARAVDQGANVVLLQAPTDAEFHFRQRPRRAWLTANTRIYLDALRDPRRGREQAQAFREAVMGV